MNNREKLTRMIIEAIHELPYEEAVDKETHIFGCIIKHKKRGVARYIKFGKSVKNILFENELEPIYAIDIGGNSKVIGIPITIGRVMQALNNKIDTCVSYRQFYMHSIKIEHEGRLVCNWKLTKENGEECTIEDQNEETIDKLLELF